MLYKSLRAVGMTPLVFILTLCLSKVFAQQQTLENNLICMDPIVGRGAYINAANSGLCVGCTAASGANIVDGNLTNFATLTTGVAVAGGARVSVKDSLQYYPAGNAVGFVVKFNGTLLSATILNEVQIRTYRNNVLQETAQFSSGVGLLSASVLANSGGKQMLRFNTTKDFDEVQLIVPNVVAALTSIDVYYAFEGPASCPVDCINALTGTDIQGGETGASSGTFALNNIIPCVALGTEFSFL